MVLPDRIDEQADVFNNRIHARFDQLDKQALLRSLAYKPLYPAISSLGEERFPTLQDCNALLAIHQPTITVHSGLPLRFVEQEYGKLPFESQYERAAI